MNPLVLFLSSGYVFAQPGLVWQAMGAVGLAGAG